MVNGHACHGVVEVLAGCLAGVGMYDGIGCDHALIHAIESKLATIGTPEKSTMDAELVLMYRATVDKCWATIGGDLYLFATACGDIDVVVLDDSRCL